MDMNLPKVGYWIFNYAPKWEAASKEVEILSTDLGSIFDTHLVSMNMKNAKVCLRGRFKYLPLPFALAGLPLLSKLAGSFRVNHVFSSAAERLLLPRLGKFNTLLTITKDASSLGSIEKNGDHLKKMQCIVVESEWHREILCQLGIRSEKLKLIYPGTTIKPYQQASGPFKILFASSPPDKYGFLSRGVFLLIQVARLLPEVQFILVWREHEYQKLCNLLADAEVQNVKVLNGYIPDMDSIYQSVHATVLPGLAANSLKPSPHSGLDSLAHGKPLLVSHPTSFSGLVKKKQCGTVFEPTIESLQRAIRCLMENYDFFQNNCHRTIEGNFSKEIFLDRYRQIYQVML